MSELIQQDRTVWFVRQFKDGDGENEIVLLNSNIVQPHDFSEKYYEVNGNSILWLSDIHFPQAVFPSKEGPSNTTLTQHIKKCCDDNKIFDDIGGLIITGDITDCGKPEGFECAINFIQDLNREIKQKLESENIIFCAGNHDLIRKNERLDKNEVPKWVFDYKESIKHYSGFFNNIYHIKPNKFLASGRKLLLGSAQTIEVVALNSLILQQYENFEGHGYISQEQLDFVEEKMGWSKKHNSSSVRIVIMHHHYLPTCLTETIDVNKPSSTVYDAARLMGWLVKNNVRLLLHGHKHNSFFTKVAYPKEITHDVDYRNMQDIVVVGMGSTGAKGVDNKFGTITFNTDTITIKFYKIDSNTSTEDVLVQTITIPFI